MSGTQKKAAPQAPGAVKRPHVKRREAPGRRPPESGSLPSPESRKGEEARQRGRGGADDAFCFPKPPIEAERTQKEAPNRR